MKEMPQGFSSLPSLTNTGTRSVNASRQGGVDPGPESGAVRVFGFSLAICRGLRR